MIGTVWEFAKKHFALLVVTGTFLWSAFAIVTYRRQQVPPGVNVVLRLGHWQLEGGVRDAFDRMAAEYRRQHPDVLIVQDAIPESTYAQWLTTQLMGGTGPDLIEVGMMPYSVLLGFHNRYFTPLTASVNVPNPYNAGTDLESVPWRKTYKDGMRNGYVEELQEYMMIPLSQFGIRVFYNKDLLKALTGREEAPRNFREFLAACEAIKSHRDAQGRPYAPIAGSAIHINEWDSFMCDPLTYGAVRRVDFNRDGAVGGDELFVGFKSGRIGFDFPPFAAKFRMLRELSDERQSGYTGLGRDEAVFLFAQQRAVFISGGTWDAGSLVEQARGVFALGIMDFPMPGRDDPEFGEVVEGPAYERPSAGFCMAITRTSKHPEVALDFLRFITSRAGNEQLNGIIGWIPAINGTRMSPLMQAMEPHLEGVYGAMPIAIGGETMIRWQQLYALFQIGQIDYAGVVKDFLPFYMEKGVEEFAELQRNRRRGRISDEQFLTGFRALAMATPEAERAARLVKYRQLTASRLIERDLDAALLQRRLNEGQATNAVAPYEFSPEVIGRVRARLSAAGKGGG